MGMFSDFIGGYSSIAKEAVDGFLNLVLKSSMSISEISNLYSDKIDEIIVLESKSGLTYVGGHFKLSIINDKFFDLSYELFFQDKRKEWVKKTAKSKPQSIEFLNTEAQLELKKEKVISFEINMPENDIDRDMNDDLKDKVIQLSERRR